MQCRQERKTEKKRTFQQQMKIDQIDQLHTRLSGVLTVELAYLIPVIMFVFQLIMYSVFYYHDKIILMGAAGETAVVAAQYERKADGGKTTDIERFFREQTVQKLILFSDVDMEMVQSDDKIEIAVSAQRGYMQLEVRQSAVISRPEKTIRRVQVLQKWITDQGETEGTSEKESKKESEKETESKAGAAD